MDSTVPPVIPVEKTTEVRSREDFLKILEITATEIDGFVAREPAYQVWAVLQRQLATMREWVANGGDPTPPQRDRISIGLVAARELEPAQDAAMEDLQ